MKVLGIFEALFKVLLTVVILYAVDYGVAYVMLRAGYDFDIYEGVFAAVSGLLTILILYVFAKVEARICDKKEKKLLIKFNMIKPVELIYVLVIALALLGIVAIYLMITSVMAESVEPVSTAVEEYSESMQIYDLQTDYPKWDQLLYVIAITCFIPIAEEFAFRGLIYGSVNRQLNGAWAIAISSVVFGILHGLSIHIIYALACGIILGVTYYAFNSIFATIIIHAVFNFFGSAIYNLADLLGIDHNAIPSFYGLQFMAILPAVLILVKMSRDRYLSGKNTGTEVVLDEQA